MRYTFPVALLATLVSASAVAAQQPAAATKDAPASTQPPAAASAEAGATAAAQARTAGDSIRIEITPELQRTLDELAASLERVGRRIANDPELRASAVRAAQGFVGVAQLMVVQQTEMLQEVLRTMSERLATLPAPPPAQPLQH